MKSSVYTACLSVLSGLIWTGSATALQVDFQPDDAAGGDTQAGYTAVSGGINDGFNGNFANTTLTVSGDTFELDVIDGAGSFVGMDTTTAGAIVDTDLDDLLRDALADASNIRLRFDDLNPGITYLITFYFHAEADANDGFGVTAASGGDSFISVTRDHSGASNAGTTPSTVDVVFSANATATNNRVQFNFNNGGDNSGKIYINGFDLNIIPEPATAGLLMLALPMLLRRHAS